MYIISLCIAAIAGVFYHVTQKSLRSTTDPAFSLIVTFSVALSGTIIWYAFKDTSNTLAENIKTIHWDSITLGLAIIALEFGIMLAYRSGWQISNFNLFYTLLVAIILIPVGLIFFKESINIKTLSGMVITIMGILIMRS